jgi:hypothetical protein
VEGRPGVYCLPCFGTLSPNRSTGRVNRKVLLALLIANTVANLSAGAGQDNSTYQIGPNGLVIPDYSQNRGLSVLVDAKSKATECLAAAMNLMGRLPTEVLQRMSSHSQRFSKATNLGWSGTWSLMRKLYAEEYTGYNEIIEGIVQDWDFTGSP